jgi:hypothetical protein
MSETSYKMMEESKCAYLLRILTGRLEEIELDSAVFSHLNGKGNIVEHVYSIRKLISLIIINKATITFAWGEQCALVWGWSTGCSRAS